MRDYRKAFILAIVGNIALVALLTGLWWHSHGGDDKRPASSVRSDSLAESSSVPPAPASSSPAEPALAPVQLSADRLQSIGVKFGTVERKELHDEIRVTGNVAVDETRLSYVQTRFSGYIQKVFADATYKYVRRGQPLFTIYSPELATAEREYLSAKQTADVLSRSTVPGVSAGISSLLAASTERLKQWNVPQKEIARLESTGEVRPEIAIDSPSSGYITERNALPNLTVQPDTRLYTIADLSTVWIFAQVFQNDLGRFRIGETAALTVDSYPGKTLRGKVDFIYPDVDMTTRTARVRLIFANRNMLLSPGMFVNVVLEVPLGNQLVVPVDGVIQSGTRQIVFLNHGDGYLEPREVQLGAQADDHYIILKGLKQGDHIVTSANFLIDSESQLQAAIGSFAPPPPGAGVSAAMNGAATKPASGTIEFSTHPSPARKGVNIYRIKLTGPDGLPISGAKVTVRSYMPAMPAMGMAAMNVLTPLTEKGAGFYEGSCQLDSGGTWQITVSASKDGSVVASRKLSLNAEGGM